MTHFPYIEPGWNIKGILVDGSAVTVDEEGIFRFNVPTLTDAVSKSAVVAQAIVSALSIGGTLGVTGATSLSSVSTSGNATVGGTLGVTGATSLSSVSTSGNATIGGTLGVTGQATFNSAGVNTSNLFGSKFAVSGGTVNVGTSIPDTILVFAGFTGTTASGAGTNRWWNEISVSSDTASLPTTSLLADLHVAHNFGGTGFQGGRTNLLLELTQTGDIAADEPMVNINAYVNLTSTFGGTGLKPSQTAGSAFGMNPYISFKGTSSNLRGASGIEANFEAHAGNTYLENLFYSAVHTASHVQGPAVDDIGFLAADQVLATPTETAAFQVGSRLSQWPLASSGSVIRTELSVNDATNPSTAAYGADFLTATFSKSFLRSKAFAVDGATGTVRVGAAYLTPSAGGLDISASGSIGAFSAIVAGGTGWPTDGNSYYATDIYDGIYKLTLAAGVVTGVTVYRAPYVNGSTPANPITLTPDKNAATWAPTATTINLTWTSAPLLTLQSSGGGTKIAGTVGFNGTAPIAKPTVTGSRGSNAALASLLTALASYGLLTDSSS